MSSLHWLNPWWLLLTIVPLPLLWWLKNIRHNGPTRLAQFIQRHLWPQVLSAPSQHKRQNIFSFLLVWCLLCIALAGPFLVKSEPQQFTATAANIAIIVDISPSMGAEDVAPNRLEQAKKMLATFSQSLSTDRLALIAFSANAYTVLPLSRDAQAFRHFLQQLDPSLAYVAGSNLGRALRLANDTLTNDDHSGGLVLLVSDGELHDTDAIRAAADLHQAGHTLISVGVGTAEGGPVPLAGGQLLRRDGKIFTSQLQRTTLEQLARAGGGRYYDLGPNIWPDITAVIEQLQKNRYQAELNPQMGQALFPALIFLALMILFWQGLQRPQGLVLILTGALLFLNHDPADAAPWDEQRGLEQLQDNDNQGALQTYSRLDNYTGRMGQGAAAYGLGNWQQALGAFEQAYRLADNDEQRAQAAYNQGNALTRLQQLDQASEAYERAIRLRGSYSRASFNLTLVNQLRENRSGLQQGDDEKEQQRPGQSQTQQSDTGAGGNQNATPSSGTTANRQGLSDTNSAQPGQREKQNASDISQSLAQWSQLPQTAETLPAQVWQQYQQLKEDNQTMLKRRFEIEDKRVFGRAGEKPW